MIDTSFDANKSEYKISESCDDYIDTNRNKFL